jgi:hypothetical protein
MGISHMKKTLLTFAALTGFSLTSGAAQELPRPPAPRDGAGVTLPGPQPAAQRTWSSSYQQETARDYIRRRAQEKAEARQARIEGMRWLGYSPLRPTVNAVPYTSHLPAWTPFGVGAYWYQPYWYHPVNLGASAALP